MDATDRPRRRVPGLAAWLVGTLVGLPIAGALGACWVVVAPHAWLRTVDGLLPEPLTLRASRIALDTSAGVWAPWGWTWQVEELSFVGAPPDGPNVWVDRAAIGVPRVVPTASLGVRVVVPAVRMGHLTLAWPERKVPEARRWQYRVVEAIAVGAVHAERLDLVMAEDGPRPSVVIAATDVTLDDGALDLRSRSMTGTGVVSDAFVSVAGVAFEQVRSDDVVFTGSGLTAGLTATLQGSAVQASLSVDPLMGPPLVVVDARMPEGQLGALAEGIVGLRPGFVSATVTVDAHLEAGRPLPGANTVRGHATVDAVDIALELPPEAGLALRTGVRLAPFLTLRDGVVGVPPLHGRVAFTGGSLSLLDLELEAPHSVGHLDGTIAGSAVHARLDMHPRPGHAAVRWGLFVDGPFGGPEVRLVFPPALDAWEP